MPNADFVNFFLASAGAGGALIGLLFVAISIDPERTVQRAAKPLSRISASSALTALSNAFFISLAALVPRDNIGYVTLIFGILGMFNTLGLIISLLRDHISPQDRLRGSLLILGALAIYALEIQNGVALARNGHNLDIVSTICVLIIAVYGLGLVRAWELLGAQQQGIIHTMLSLRRRDDSAHSKEGN
jgi:hypothetical protein